MGRRYVIEFRAEHVTAGVPRRTRGCDVFLAVEEILGSLVLAVRGNGSIVIRSALDRFGVDALLSPADARKLKDAVEAIDAGLGELVEPFTFTLEVPDHEESVRDVPPGRIRPPQRERRRERGHRGGDSGLGSLFD